MHSDIQRGVQMLHAVVQFGRKNPLTPSNARAEVLLADVGAAAGEIRAMAAAQESSRSGFLSRSEERRFVAGKIREILRQIALLGKFLPKEHSEVRYKLRVPRSNGYYPLLTYAELFLKFTAPIKSEFLDRGMPADFDVQLRDLMERFEAISGDRDSARSRQVGSTAGMKARLRIAVRSVRELNAILTLLLRNDPARFASWRAVSHIERAPRRNKAIPEQGEASDDRDEVRVERPAIDTSAPSGKPEQSALGVPGSTDDGPTAAFSSTKDNDSFAGERTGSPTSTSDAAGDSVRGEAPKAPDPQLGLW